MMFLGTRKPQKIKQSSVVTIPAIWIKQFAPDKIRELSFFMDENLNLIIKAPGPEDDTVIVDEDSKEKPIQEPQTIPKRIQKKQRFIHLKKINVDDLDEIQSKIDKQTK